jgi:large subunit ribosomal protein L17
MRHGKKVNHLSRTDSHRRAMLANMASSLILHKRITTTLAKAKALRVYVEPIITKSKDDTTHSRRTVFSYLQNKEVVSILFRDVAAKVASRPGGYTRILKMGNRLGDNASMALIELVDYNEVYTSGDVAATEKKSTRRRGSKAKKTDAPAAAEKAPRVEAAPAEEAVAVEETPVAEVETAPVAETVEAPVAEAEEVAVTEEAPAAEEATPEAPAAEGDDTEEKKA